MGNNISSSRFGGAYEYRVLGPLGIQVSQNRAPHGMLGMREDNAKIEFNGKNVRKLLFRSVIHQVRFTPRLDCAIRGDRLDAREF